MAKSKLRVIRLFASSFITFVIPCDKPSKNLAPSFFQTLSLDAVSNTNSATFSTRFQSIKMLNVALAWTLPGTLAFFEFQAFAIFVAWRQRKNHSQSMEALIQPVFCQVAIPMQSYVFRTYFVKFVQFIRGYL